MKNIYHFCITLMLLLSFTAQAQRNVDLEMITSYVGTTQQNMQPVTATTKLLANDDGSSKYYMAWKAKNNGPDSLVVGDSLKFRSVIAERGISLYFDFVGKGLKKDSFITIVPEISSGSNPMFENDGAGNGIFKCTSQKLFPVSGSPATSGPVNVDWCDSVFASKGMANTAINLTTPGNDDNCANITVEIWLTGVNTISKDADGFLLFPNPASGVLNVKYDFEKATDATISVRDVTGKLVHLAELKNVSGTQQYTIDISKLAPGMYTAELNTGEKKVVSKVTIK